MNKEDLNQLPKAVTDTFKQPFVFLIFPELVQHFPARNWSQKQLMAKLHEILGETIYFDHWQGYLIAKNADEALIVLIPGYETLTDD